MCENVKRYMDITELEDAFFEVDEGIKELETDILVLKAGVARGTLSRDAIIRALDKILEEIKVVK